MQDSDCKAGQTCENNVCTCSNDSDCGTSQTCQNGKCQEVTCDSLSCGANAQCVISDNEASCECKSGYHTLTDAHDGCGELFLYWRFWYIVALTLSLKTVFEKLPIKIIFSGLHKGFTLRWWADLWQQCLYLFSRFRVHKHSEMSKWEMPRSKLWHCVMWFKCSLWSV